LVRFFQSEVLINARAATVWQVLSDGTNFGVWESGILEADGPIPAGDTVHITPVGGRRPVKLRVQQIEGEVMTWKRSLPLGLWARTRTFTLTADAAHTRLTVTEDHRGLLLPFSKHPDADPFLDRFTEAVRARSEILDRVS
jgi:hypothetical protein